LPYAFASHFAPQQLKEALHIYRSNFKASEHLKEPYAIACINVTAAATRRSPINCYFYGRFFWVF
jgi:alkanesulfonate monooxygenase SsuD/methylene tetrahydromethanopterin reductase-like flavin-dependent oxidoreductase (luciferase family)